MSTNTKLKARYPRIDDPIEAIHYALEIAGEVFHRRSTGIDFLEAWREGAWSEIERDYPQFLERVA